MSKLRNLTTALLLSGAVASGAASGDIIKNTKEKIQADFKIEQVDGDKKDSLEKEKGDLEKIIHRMVKDFKYRHSKSYQEKYFSQQEYELILREIIDSEKYGLAYNNACFVEIDNKKYRLHAIKNQEELDTIKIADRIKKKNILKDKDGRIDTLKVSDWETSERKIKQANDVIDFYAQKATKEPHQLGGDNQIGNLSYTLEQERKTMEQYVGKFGYKLSRKLIFFWKVDKNGNFDYDYNKGKIEGTNLFVTWIDVPEPIKYTDVKKDTVAKTIAPQTTQQQIKETEKEMNEIFEYGKKVIFKANLKDFTNKKVEEGLDKLYEMLEKNPSLKIKVTGYYGGEHPTLPLERAEKVKKYLIYKGIDEKRIQTEGGKEKFAQSIKIEIIK